MLDPDIKVNY